MTECLINISLKKLSVTAPLSWKEALERCSHRACTISFVVRYSAHPTHAVSRYINYKFITFRCDITNESYASHIDQTEQRRIKF